MRKTGFRRIENSILVVSCYFGVRESTVLPPPAGLPSRFFTNNHATSITAKNSGWTVINVGPQFEATNDELVSAIQSKYVKFVQFIDDFPELGRYDYFLYTDHKNQLSREVGRKMMSKVRGQKTVVIRKHAEYRDNVMIEVAESMNQDRYSQNMGRTLAWIDNLEKVGYRRAARVPNTGIILWKNHPTARNLGNQIHSVITDQGQPQCQIIWTIASQPFSSTIRAVKYNSLGIRPKQHPSGMRIWVDRILAPARTFVRYRRLD